jgi:hypothetical protein
MLEQTIRHLTFPALALGAALGLIALAGCGSGDPSPTTSGGASCAAAADCDGWLAEQGLADGCVRGTCSFGQCRAVAKADSCDDGDPCTADSCNAETGACQHAIGVGLACDDGASCTTADACGSDGACHGTPTAACGCGTAADCPVPTGADLCATTLVCTDAHVCASVARDAVECPESVDPCQVTECAPTTGLCVASPGPDGVACVPDGGTVADGKCAAGICEPPPGCEAGQPCCDDGDPCTKDIPDGSDSCRHVANTGALCDDGNACTKGDVCHGTACYGTAIKCDDGNPCTADACDPGTAACAYVAFEGPCDDGDVCTTGDTCQAGACNGIGLACDDGNPCTADSCTVAAGKADCAHVDQDFGCDDGNPFTSPDLCHAGVCVSGPSQPCADSAQCDAIAGSNLCVGAWYCDPTSRTCVAVPETVVACPTAETPCTFNACVPATGKCAPQPKPDGFACDDGDACTDPGICVDGGCASPPKDCDDLDPCTADLCSAGECSYLTLLGGDSLLAPDFSAGLPLGWTVSSTNDELGWRVISGRLVVSGPDGTYDHGAARAEIRSPEFWVYGGDVSAEFDYQFANGDAKPSCFGDHLGVFVEHNGLLDQVACFAESATDWKRVRIDLSPFQNSRVRLVIAFSANAEHNAGFGAQVNVLQVVANFTCDPSQPCSGGICGLDGCAPQPLDCDDNDPCTADACDIFTSKCIHTALEQCACTAETVCPGGGPCAVASCGADGFCVLEPMTGSCDDGNACTSGDTCVDGHCVSELVSCDDHDPCTKDVCDPSGGCAHIFSAAPCDDGNPCTVGDACVQGGGCQGMPKVCESWSSCAAGVCGADGECSFDIKHDGQVELKESFDNIVPGALPAGWQVASDDPTLGWITKATGAPSQPNALVLDAAHGPHGDFTISAQSPAIRVPEGGGTLRFWFIAALPDATCDSDVLAVLVDDRIAALVCSGTEGFVQAQVDLGPAGLDMGGRTVSVTFQVLSLTSGEGGPWVGIDGVEVIGSYPCDDGKTCTTADRCELGLCKGTAKPGCK